MSTSEQSTSLANSGRSRKRSLSPDLNMDHISSGSTFSQNIESIEGLRSLHADQEVFYFINFSRNFLNVEDFYFIIIINCQIKLNFVAIVAV